MHVGKAVTASVSCWELFLISSGYWTHRLMESDDALAELHCTVEVSGNDTRWVQNSLGKLVHHFCLIVVIADHAKKCHPRTAFEFYFNGDFRFAPDYMHFDACRWLWWFHHIRRTELTTANRIWGNFKSAVATRLVETCCLVMCVQKTRLQAKWSQHFRTKLLLNRFVCTWTF